ncbi:hypothetical protein [Mucilaginibacter panaciglaebae]|uniref:YD repeat-containing protein n=1 Tax=Mucilaginibacter panaciglaebae TaxID=502331 RepID=A0ABP7X173_9SPHI
MKTVNQLALTILLASLGVSCKKVDSVPATLTSPTVTTNKIKYLVGQIFSDSTKNGVTITTTTYTYDDKKRLSTEKSTGGNYTFVYNDYGELFSITNNLNSQFSIYSQEFRYNGGKITTAVRHSYTHVPQLVDNYAYVYTGNNVTELHINGDSGYKVTVYTFDANNNLIKSDYNLEDQVNFYTFDDKKSPYTAWSLAIKSAMAGSADVCSTNNILTQKAMYSNAVITYTYTYNSDGYPLTRRTSNGIVTRTVKYVYATL